MKAAPWTDAHRREALRSILRRCDVVAATGPLPDVGRIEIGPRHFETEAAFRRTLAGFGLDPARVAAEVRRVRALVDGRLVREERVVWRIVDRDMLGITIWEGSERPDESEERAPWVIVRVHVTRIRRPS